MFKIIFLPNKNFFPYGLFFKIFNKKKINLFKFLIYKFIKKNCGGFGKCKLCSIFIIESSFKLNNIFVLSCSTYLDNNIILKI